MTQTKQPDLGDEVRRIVDASLFDLRSIDPTLTADGTARLLASLCAIRIDAPAELEGLLDYVADRLADAKLDLSYRTPEGSA